MRDAIQLMLEIKGLVQHGNTSYLEVCLQDFYVEFYSEDK